MRLEFPTGAQRAHTLTEQAVRCPNAGPYGAKAAPGAIVVYRETYVDGSHAYRTARVLGRVITPSDGTDVPAFDGLSVLALADNLSHAYLRWVDPADVTEVCEPSPLLMTWFMGEWPRQDVVMRLADYGSLCERYATGIDERTTEIQRQIRAKAKRA